jgi:nitroimidazol reductase NimA-like FMN-containing flavoprotein (pyridoxamine 5'-phosphate oxidase superfamily)
MATNTTKAPRTDRDVGSARQEPNPTALTTERAWKAIGKASFGVLSYVTPSGDPRCSGIMYRTAGRRLYVAVDAEGWKAKHIGRSGRVSMTVTVHRGGVMALLAPIPPATITFSGRASVLPPGSPEADAVLEKVRSLLPAERRDVAAVIEIVPQGTFVTYGVGVPLMKMRDTTAARGRVPVR